MLTTVLLRGVTVAPRDRLFVRREAALVTRFGCRASGLLLALALIAGCNCSPRVSSTLAWLEGDWQGVRRDAASGEEASLTVHVEALRDGAQQVERLQVRQADGSIYTGFAVRTPTKTPGRWTMLYANSTRGTFSRLEGEVEKDKVTWHSVTPGRTRTSHVVVERLGPDRWRRTNEISEDGGKTWRALFVDDVERKDDSR